MGAKKLAISTPSELPLQVVYRNFLDTAKKCKREYYLNDHLGNTRIIFSDLNNNGTIDITGIDGTNEIIEESHYYPFGMLAKGPWINRQTPNQKNKYGYNGKELQELTGYLDYQARHYDPTIARWLSLDPLAEKYTAWSSYNYTLNNPIVNIDPTGMSVEQPDWIDNGDGTYTAEDGDSAASLAEDAGISLERADEVVQSQHGPNYTGADGEAKSNVDPGDVVAVPEQVEEFEANKEATEKKEKEIAKNNETIKANEAEAKKLTKERDVTQRKLDLSNKMNERTSDFPDEPKGGLGLGVGIKNTIREMKIRKLNKEIKKIGSTTDSLKNVNRKLRNN